MHAKLQHDICDNPLYVISSLYKYNTKYTRVFRERKVALGKGCSVPNVFKIVPRINCHFWCNQTWFHIVMRYIYVNIKEQIISLALSRPLSQQQQKKKIHYAEIQIRFRELVYYVINSLYCLMLYDCKLCPKGGFTLSA